MPKTTDQKQPPAEPSIDIRTPGLVEAFDSVGAMQAWELLRRSGTPLTAAELARIARMPVRTVQRALDRFETVALVRRHPGRKANTAVRWSVTRPSSSSKARGSPRERRARRRPATQSMNRARHSGGGTMHVSQRPNQRCR